MSASPAQENTVRLVKDAAQIVDVIGECVALKRSGVNLKGRCPFHAEKTPSFMVNPDRQSFHCFGCGEGGDVFSFMMAYHRMTFPEALKSLANRYHITLPEREYSAVDQARAKKREVLFAANERAAAVYHDFLSRDPGAEQARAYLKERGMTPEIIESFKIGYAPDSWDFLVKRISRGEFSPALAEEAGLLVSKPQGGYYDRFRDRILFPIFDLTGRVVGFGGRILGDGQPKYLNSPETPIYDKSRTLFGLYQHRDKVRQARRAVIVEGNFDLLALAVHGLDNVVAPLGTALTQAQVRVLKGYADEVILLFDGDAAGLKAALRSVPIFLAEQVAARIAVLPAEHDPDTFIREQGRAGLEKLLDNSAPLMDFVFDQLVDKYGTAVQGKARILEELRPLIESTGDNPLQRSVLVSHFSDRLRLDPGQVLSGFKAAGRTKSGRRPATDGQTSRELTLPRVQRHLLEFLILYPQFLERFVGAGIEDVLDDPAALNIFNQLQEIGTVGGPEQLLDLLPAGPERTFVSSLLVSAPVLSEEDRDAELEKMVIEKLAWLAAYRLKKEKDGLARDIEAAQQAGDDELLMTLHVRKVEINQALDAAAAEQDDF